MTYGSTCMTPDYVEATRDLMTYATMAFVSGSAAAEADAKRTWKEVALQYFHEAARDTKAPKLYRTKVYEFLATSNFMLLVGTGHGWDKYIVSDDNTTSPLSWPSATVCVDQGSDGWSALHYLRHGPDTKRNLLVLHDESHRLWNCCQHAIADAKLYPLVLSSLIVLNVDSGPWNSHRWYGTMKEAVAELANVANAQDPLFQHLVHIMRAEVAQESGREEHDISDDAVWLSLKDAVERKTEKIGLTRWFGYFHAMQEFQKVRGRRLFIVLYVALSMGMFSKQKLSELGKLQTPPPAAAGEDIPKSSTAQDRSEVQKLRSSCKNTLAFAALVLSDSSVWTLNAVLVEIATPVTEYHSMQNRRNRSARESLEHWQWLASGCGFEHVDAIRQRLDDETIFIRLGLHTSKDGDKKEVLGLSSSDAVVESETDVVAQMATFAVRS
eukprot:2683899-Amphidinium_carterae.4